MSRGGIAANRGSLRRTTRTACRKESLVGVEVGLQRGLVHQLAHRVVRQQQAAELLPYQVGLLAAQHTQPSAKGWTPQTNRGSREATANRSTASTPISSSSPLDGLDYAASVGRSRGVLGCCPRPAGCPSVVSTQFRCGTCPPVSAVDCHVDSGRIASTVSASELVSLKRGKPPGIARASRQPWQPERFRGFPLVQPDAGYALEEPRSLAMPPGTSAAFQLHYGHRDRASVQR